MDYPKFIVSNKKEYSISILQRVKAMILSVKAGYSHSRNKHAHLRSGSNISSMCQNLLFPYVVCVNSQMLRLLFAYVVIFRDVKIHHTIDILQ